MGGFLQFPDLAGRFAERIVEFFSEVSDNRILQELVNPDVFFAPFYECILADIPSVEVDGSQPVPQS